ncbi:C6 transcription factor [Pyrenophora seminiperda CCB06]|uniref:C6 transcription factor n=1 Tax=Pyrenophora seminiperda CCB06 TaxID=1302712 RepID=A0A3M7MFX0_9PLEO|nr:C6 transcription factor [Pyrenophora seminiperda CCB06]
MLNQLQSPFFRLPRELRDMVYEYYLHDAEGVFYACWLDKLMYTVIKHREPGVALMRSCKLAAEEIQLAAVRVNQYFYHYICCCGPQRRQEQMELSRIEIWHLLRHFAKGRRAM